MSSPVVEALFDAGLMTAALPSACGGAEADLVTQVLLYEELSAAEPSAGWSHMAGATATAFAAAFMADDAVEEMFGDGRSVTAGQFAPRGTFQTVDGGYRVTGQYGFASGSGHAAYIMAGGTVLDADGEMPPGLRALVVRCWAAEPAARPPMQARPSSVCDAWWSLGRAGDAYGPYDLRPSQYPMISDAMARREAGAAARQAAKG